MILSVDWNPSPEGKDREVSALFEGPGRKLKQITIRNGAVLAKHTAAVPIVVQCVAGSGSFIAEGSTVALQPGVMLTPEPNIPHEVTADPMVSILVTWFDSK